MRCGPDVVAGPTLNCEAGGSAAVLARDRSWALERGGGRGGRGVASGRQPVFRDGGGMPPISLAPLSGRYLSLSERKEIAILHAQRAGVREIARRLNRSASTISRELRRNASERRCHTSHTAKLLQHTSRTRYRIGDVANLQIEDRPPVARESLVESEVWTRQSPQPDYLDRNRDAWNLWAHDTLATGRKAWLDQELRWGLWDTPESNLHLLRDLEPGVDVVELGCGTAAISASLSRRDMRPVAVDFSPAQLAHAERFQHEFGLSFPLICANAEEVPFDESSFDVAVSEYGASLWCDPRRWLPEAHRLLRVGGQLIFFTSGAILMACTPPDGGRADGSLVRDSFASYRVEFPGASGVEFHGTHGHWVRLLRTSGFVLENLIEVRPPRRAKARFDFVSVDWARRWPSEEIWIARKVS